MRGALPSVEQSRDEYIGSVYGAAALAYISIMHATEALDMLQERLPGNYKDAKKYASRITGTKASMGEIRRLELAIGDQLAQASSRAWMADFGNAAYERVLPQVTSLQTAIDGHRQRPRTLPLAARPQHVRRRGGCAEPRPRGRGIRQAACRKVHQLHHHHA